MKALLCVDGEVLTTVSVGERWFVAGRPTSPAIEFSAGQPHRPAFADPRDFSVLTHTTYIASLRWGQTPSGCWGLRLEAPGFYRDRLVLAYDENPPHDERALQEAALARRHLERMLKS